MTTAIEKMDKADMVEAVGNHKITRAQWRTLKQSLYPGASDAAVLMVLDYCAARKLDPLKKPCHIVSVQTKTGEREIVMPGIYELRTTAQRTGEYLGHSAPDYGPIITIKGTQAPEWCAITFYRWHAATGQKIEFPITTWFREVVATNRDVKANPRWAQAPTQMLTKCCEAAGLREAFPDEIGGEHAAEELDGQRLRAEPEAPPRPSLAKPEHFDDWLAVLVAKANEGAEAFAQCWATAEPAHRAYLTATDADQYEQLKALADAKEAKEAKE